MDEVAIENAVIDDQFRYVIEASTRHGQDPGVKQRIESLVLAGPVIDAQGDRIPQRRVAVADDHQSIAIAQQPRREGEVRPQYVDGSPACQ